MWYFSFLQSDLMIRIQFLQESLKDPITLSRAILQLHSRILTLTALAPTTLLSWCNTWGAENYQKITHNCTYLEISSGSNPCQLPTLNKVLAENWDLLKVTPIIFHFMQLKNMERIWRNLCKKIFPSIWSLLMNPNLPRQSVTLPSITWEGVCTIHCTLYASIHYTVPK